MKIASKPRNVLVSSAVAAAILLTAGGAMAQTTTQATTTTTTVSIPDSSTVTLDLPAPAPASAAAPANTAAARGKNMSALEDKVTDATKNVVKQLSEVNSVNLDDLNTARQAVLKLELLIDIEKHLAELDKIHSERTNEKSLASSIPASALMPATALPAPRATTHVSRVSETSSGNMNMGIARSSDVTQIVGADGHYAAMVQGKTFRVGDNLPDGSTIVSIATKEVTVKKNGTVRQLKIKGVDEVYGHPL